MPGRRPETGIELELNLAASCIGCGHPREPEGQKILHEGKTFVIRSQDPCECGEQRIKVVWTFEVQG